MNKRNVVVSVNSKLPKLSLRNKSVLGKPTISEGNNMRNRAINSKLKQKFDISQYKTKFIELNSNNKEIGHNNKDTKNNFNNITTQIMLKSTLKKKIDIDLNPFMKSSIYSSSSNETLRPIFKENYKDLLIENT